MTDTTTPADTTENLIIVDEDTTGVAEAAIAGALGVAPAALDGFAANVAAFGALAAQAPTVEAAIAGLRAAIGSAQDVAEEDVARLDIAFNPGRNHATVRAVHRDRGLRVMQVALPKKEASDAA